MYSTSKFFFFLINNSLKTVTSESYQHFRFTVKNDQKKIIDFYVHYSKWIFNAYFINGFNR